MPCAAQTQRTYQPLSQRAYCLEGRVGALHNTESKTQADFFVCLFCVGKLTLNKRPRIKSSCFFSILSVLQHKHDNEIKKGEKMVLTLQVLRRAVKPNSV